MTLTTSVDHAPGGARRPASHLEAVDVSAWFGTHKVLDRVSLSMRSERLRRVPVSLRPAVTFSAMVMAGNGLGFWKTMPMRRRVSVTRRPGA